MQIKTNTLCTLFFFFWCNIGMAQYQRSFTIGILEDKSSEKTQQDFDEFTQEIQGVVGDKVKIITSMDLVLSSEYDFELAKKNYETMVNDNRIDLIISFGPLNNFMLNKVSNFKKPVIIYGQLDTDFSSLPSDGAVSGIKNLTYVVVPQSFKDDINEFHELYNFSKLGILIDSKVYDAFKQLQRTIDNNLIDADFELVPIPFTSVEQLESDLEEIDAVFLSIGLYRSQQEYKEISNLFIEKKIPSFSTIGELTAHSGFLLSKGNEENIQQIRRRIALNIEDIVNGVPLEKIPIYLKDERSIYYNFETAARIGFESKKSTLSNFVMVGDLENMDLGKHYTLQEMMKQLTANSLSINANKKDILIAEKASQLAKRQYLPEVKLSNTLSNTDSELAQSAIGGESWQNVATAQVDQIIYSQEVSSAIRIAELSELATRFDYNTSLLNELSDLSNNYFSAMIARTNYHIEFENCELTRQNYHIAKQNYESGQTGKADVLRWESEMAKCSQRMVSFWSAEQNSLEVLNQQLNNPIGTQIYLQAPTSAEELQNSEQYKQLIRDIDDPERRKALLEILTSMAVERAPEIHSLIANQNATLEQIKQYQRSRYIPTVALSGSYDYRPMPNKAALQDGYYTVGLSLSLPIYQGGQRILNKQRSMLMADQLAITTQNTETQIELNVSTLFKDLVSNLSNIYYSGESVKASKESLALMQISYETGAVSITSLIDAQSAYISARSDNETALFTFLTSSLQLERSIGYFFDTEEDFNNRELLKQIDEVINSMVNQK